MEVSDENKKRVRDDSTNSPSDMPETKRVRLDPEESDVESHFDSPGIEQLGATAGELAIKLPEVEAIQDDIMNILEYSDQVNSPIEGLDSVIRSLEEEILLPHVGNEASPPSGVPELGYLLGASDDELGIPPTIGLAEEDKNEVLDFPASSSSAPSGFDGISWISGYDSFDIGIDARDFVALDGLFDYSDISSESTFRTESLSALY